MVSDGVCLEAADLVVSGLAAAGNAGPGGKASYPAAYRDMVAVTAVDSQLRPYARANRGSYINLAAPGVGIWIAAPDLAGRYESGTSFAVLFVTAAIATLMMDGDTGNLADIRKALARTALDLGKPGKDEVFGWGLVRRQPPCD